MNYAAVNNIASEIDEAVYMPGNYVSTGMQGMSTGESISTFTLPTMLKGYPPAPLWKIKKGAKKYVTAKPITVKFRREDNMVFAENENLAVCGIGESPGEALDDFRSHIIYFFKYYKRLKTDQLIGDALRLKALYENLFCER